MRLGLPSVAPLQFKEIRDKTMGEPHALQVRPLAKEIPRCPILVGLQVQQLQEFVSVITYLQGVLHGELMVARVLFLLEGFKVAKVFMVDYQEVHFLGVVEAFPVIRLEEGFREAEEGFPGHPGRPGGGEGFPGPGGGGPPGGGFPGNPGGGFPGHPGGGHPGAHFAGVPAWLGGLFAQQESVRAVDLPALQELSESEIGPLIAEDWLTTVGPFLRDMSSSSSMWWDEVLNVAGNLYRIWLNSEPMERLRLVPVAPPAFQRPPWLRIEQRGSVALLKAIPESLRAELVSQREVGSVSIIFKILTVYQPGGLGERTTLLKQLVDQKVPSALGEWLTSLRAWRRWLTRVQELGIQSPDPVLLLATLDRFAAGLAKHSSQVEFRLQVTRAALRVDVAPTENGIQQFAESLVAEGEAAFHGGSTAPIRETVKVRALDGDGGGKDDGGKPRDGKEKVKEIADSKDPKDAKNGKFDPKQSKQDTKNGSSEKPVCRHFLSESGCKKGQKRSFPHEWKGVSKQGRCWTCGSTQHMKPDCPVKDVPKVKKEVAENGKHKEGAGKGDEAGSSNASKLYVPSTGGSALSHQRTWSKRRCSSSNRSVPL